MTTPADHRLACRCLFSHLCNYLKTFESIKRTPKEKGEDKLPPSLFVSNLKY